MGEKFDQNLSNIEVDPEDFEKNPGNDINFAKQRRDERQRIAQQNLEDSQAEKKPENIPGYDILVSRIKDLQRRRLMSDNDAEARLQNLERYSIDRLKQFGKLMADALTKELDLIETKAKEKPEENKAI